MKSLKGKRIYVSAAAAGIGRAIAVELARIGSDVLATDLDQAGLRGLPDSVRTCVLDGTDVEAVRELMEREAPFDGIVNAIGVVIAGTIEECTLEDWAATFEVNVGTMYNTLKPALPRMVANGGGSIVNIASAASSVKGFPKRFAYGASKGAVIGLTKSIAVDYLLDGIRCNAICPATVDSPSLRQRIAQHAAEIGDFEAAKAHFYSRQPLGRLGSPEEIAALAIYLLSDEAAYTTGQAHIIDGGLLA